uniref:3-keto-5-aminohexanoate cleavage protein n=1 Tax=Streptomyces shenzhenensis TaxID=943815 RepID=UPI0015F0DAE4
SPRVVEPAVDALRARLRVPTGVTAGAWAAPDPALWLRRVSTWSWPVLRPAGRLGLATRIGLEDTLLLPDGERALSNARLVTEALLRYGR